ncbi:MAG: glycosyltransferase family 39 protein [bacterium]|nr:glycosyltransferase family 39 protein [bacterium]
MKKLFLAISALILLAATYVRVHRTSEILGFYYDQGRDALVIADFIKNGKMFLIGPTTGIAGIFRGPFYYWLITPFYALGGGDPVWPAVFLALTTVVAIALGMYLAHELEGWRSAIIFGLVTSFSFYIVSASRWLSNPTPMLLISMLLVFSMFQITRGRSWYWAAVGLLLGLAMQFGSAAEVFYYVAIAVFAVWQRRTMRPSLKIALVSAGLLFFTFLPQIVFDLRHEGILSNNIKKFLFDDGSFKASFWEIVKIRLPFYKDTFFAKIFPSGMENWKFVAGIGLLSLGLNWKKLTNDKKFVFVLTLMLAPLVGMLFFQGNQGNVYDYYFTGYYMVFFLLLSVLFGFLARKKWGLILVLGFLWLFYQQNVPLVKSYITSGTEGESHITLGNQLQAVDWIIDDAKKQGAQFNADSYVPPVIPYAYDYLFLWLTNKRCPQDKCGYVLDPQVPLLYTLYEVDNPHPERLEAWLARQAGIGEIKEEARFGGITVQRRTRIDEKNSLLP